MAKFAERTQVGYWGKQLLNYDTYLLLAVVGGFFAIDQLYLRSPLTFLGKLLGNIFLFGIPWLYDILEGFLNDKRVKLFGTSAPMIGQLGVGGGMFLPEGSNLAPADAYTKWNFLIYSVVLMFGGLFGGDSYLLGDTLGGMIRTGLCLTVIFLPVAAVWWGLKLWEYYVNTGDLLDKHWEWFGAPKPAHPVKDCPSVLEEITIWGLTTAKTVLAFIPGGGIIVTMLDGLIASLKAAYGMVGEAKNAVIATARAANELPPAMKAMGDSLPGKFPPAVVEAKEQLKGPTAPPAAGAAEAAAAPPSAPPAPMTGGGLEEPSSAITYSLLGTLALVLVSGGGKFIKEVWQNGRRQRSRESKNDRPPEPGAI